MTMASDICGIARGVTGGATIAPEAVAWWRGQRIDAELFAIAGQAAGFAISASVAPTELGDLVRQGRIAGRAEVDDGGTVVGVELSQSGNVGATCWRSGLAEKFVPWLAQPYFASFAFARVAAQLARAHRPPASRPDGTGQPLEILVAGDIGDRHATIAPQIRDARGRPIVLNINSAGGLLEVALSIFRALAAHDCAVETRITGQALSAAGILALAGDRRLIMPGATVMFHESRLTAIEDLPSPKLRAVADRMDKLTATMTAIVAARVRIPIARAESWINTERRFTATEALRQGICHEPMPSGLRKVVPPRAADCRPAVAEQWRSRMRNRYLRGHP